ncbi:MAG: hypothetical protein QM710_02905 [Flavobacterium sp.]
MNLLKLLFGSLFSKKQTKTLIDSKLGKLTNEYEPKDQFFFWNGEINPKGKNKEKTQFTIDGDINSPYPASLQKAYEVLDRLEMLTYDVQKALDSKFPEKGINLSRDFNFQQISFFADEETGCTDFDFEYFTEDASIMVSVEFVNNKIDLIEFY